MKLQPSSVLLEGRISQCKVEVSFSFKPRPGTRRHCWIVDTDDGKVRYAIEKRISSKNRLQRQRQFLNEATGRSLRAMYFGSSGLGGQAEPFSILHRDFEERQVRQ
jgi:hypothetical protein